MDCITPSKDCTIISTDTPKLPTKRGRGRPKKSVSLKKKKTVAGEPQEIPREILEHAVITETSSKKSESSSPSQLTTTKGKQKSNADKTPETVRPRTPRKRKSGSPTWTLEDKQKFNAGLTKGGSFKKRTDGTINWQVLTKYIGTKSLKEVKEFAKYYNSLENGKTYEEFSSKAAVDVWRDLANKLVMPGDNIANVCIPQVLTVAALEPVQNSENVISHPNYSNIYNYLSSVTRGTEAPELPANDAAVVLELLEDLIKWLSKSQTLVQREFMHTRYADLRKNLTSTREESADTQYNTSTNPFAIPFDILEFKADHIANES